jgi:hypothetical protein
MLAILMEANFMGAQKAEMDQTKTVLGLWNPHEIAISTINRALGQ